MSFRKGVGKIDLNAPEAGRKPSQDLLISADAEEPEIDKTRDYKREIMV
jgi:hypothetical protein